MAHGTLSPALTRNSSAVPLFGQSQQIGIFFPAALCWENGYREGADALPSAPRAAEQIDPRLRVDPARNNRRSSARHRLRSLVLAVRRSRHAASTRRRCRARLRAQPSARARTGVLGRRFAAKHVLARRANSAGSLSSETGGDLARSPRWDEVMRPVGIGDIAAVACRDALGCWGWIEVTATGAIAGSNMTTSSCWRASAPAWGLRSAAASSPRPRVTLSHRPRRAWSSSTRPRPRQLDRDRSRVDRFPPSGSAVRRVEHAPRSRLSRSDAVALAGHPERSACARARSGRPMGHDPGRTIRGGR